MKILSDVQKVPNSGKYGCLIAKTTTYVEAIKIRELLHRIQGKVHLIPGDGNDCTEIILIWDEKPSKDTLKAIDNYLAGLFHALKHFNGDKILFLEIGGK